MADVRRLMYETHMHTPLCRHACGEVEEYAAVAERRGLKGIIVTCHNPLPGGYARGSRMSEAEFPQYVESVERARRAWAGQLEVRLGLECDWAPVLDEYVRRQVKTAPFEFLLGSVHPHVGEYQKTYWRGDAFQFQQLYFEHLAQAAETGLFDCLSHPDLVKNFAPTEWNVERILPDVLRSLDRIASTGVAMELNTSGLDKAISEMNPGPLILRQMCLRGIAVVVGSDAHVPERVADRFPQAYDLLEAAGYRQISFFLERRRHDLPIVQARQSLIGRELPTRAAG